MTRTEFFEQMHARLQASSSIRPMPGIAIASSRDTLVRQLHESVRRRAYFRVLASRKISPLRADPWNTMFDPIRAAVRFRLLGDIEEGCWLIFLAVHFGKHRVDGWRLASSAYGAERHLWTWQRVSSNPTTFIDRFKSAASQWKNDGVTRRFGNHRKYESVVKSTVEAVESYVNWVMTAGSHKALFKSALENANENPKVAFDKLYRSMNLTVSHFARTGVFDYLTTVANSDLAALEPGTPYLKGATGPLRGARLLFESEGGPPIGAQQLEQWLVELDRHLLIGMQAIEDALCNWQKSPNEFKRFRG